MTGAVEFEAVIYRQGILRLVDVPPEVASAFGEWEFPPVVVEVAGVERQTTLVPDGDGGLRLFLHDQLRRAAAVDDGDKVAIAVRLDEAPVVPWPDDVWAVAAAIEGGAQALESLPPGLSRQVREFLGSAKRAETRKKRLGRIRELLEERAAKLAGGS